MALLKKQEAFCLELGNRSGLASCYWNWGLLAREQRDHKTEREKLAPRYIHRAEYAVGTRRSAGGTGENGSS